MVVSQDDGGSVELEGSPHDDARMNTGTIDGTSEQPFEGDELMPGRLLLWPKLLSMARR